MARALIRRGVRRILMVSPTGSGKTVVALMIIEGALARGKRVLFLAHRVELIEQPSAMMQEEGIDHGVIKGTHWRTRPDQPVQIASIPTLIAKKRCKLCFPPVKGRKYGASDEARPDCDLCKGTGKIRRALPPADVVIVDECHRGLNESTTLIMESYPEATIIGFTATPWRLDGRGLGAAFDELIAVAKMSELLRDQWLVPVEVYAPKIPDLRELRRRNGDYDIEELAKLMDTKSLVGDIVEHWKKHGEDRQTIGFAVNVKHSQHLVRRFCEAGIAAEHLDGETPAELRKAVLERLRNGKTRVVWSVDVLVEGLDVPVVGCVILARPTESITRFLQSVGRGMRLHPGKRYMVLIDHAGSVNDRHRRKPADGPPEHMRALVTCVACRTVRHQSVFECQSEKCRPQLGMPGVTDTVPLERTDLHLVKIEAAAMRCEKCSGTSIEKRRVRFKDVRQAPTRIRLRCRACGHDEYIDDIVALRALPDAQRRTEYQRLLDVEKRHGFRKGWALMKYKAMFASEPPDPPKYASSGNRNLW
jgi:superfamily II DNA or RNA helicase